MTITGTNFTKATNVTFGGNAATNITVVNATTITVTAPAGVLSPFPVSVIVTTPGGSNSGNLLYSYAAVAPTVTSVNPSSGSAAGGNSVTITGTAFTGATNVTFAGAAATNIAVVNATTITAIVPAGTAGPVSVAVTTPGGVSSANTLYNYTVPAPTVASVNPASGPTTGGNTVTITGTALTGATNVTFAGVAATNITVVNATTITATVPAGTIGLVGVIVTTPGGSSPGFLLYRYVVASPTVTSVNPRSGSAAGGNSVTITGTDFTGATSVTFAGVAATSFTVVNATTITATVPGGSPAVK